MRNVKKNYRKKKNNNNNNNVNADVAQLERSNNKCYTSVFRYI